MPNIPTHSSACLKLYFANEIRQSFATNVVQSHDHLAVGRRAILVYLVRPSCIIWFALQEVVRIAAGRNFFTIHPGPVAFAALVRGPNPIANSEFVNGCKTCCES
ncbi:hypothetical protein DPMN_047622 [Dreissena polymorpha]|uniref:Uncharacterized protein n=1 Tax=Dreissena polymorpha TaxID=45954 RepID=A0A9D4HZB2_DREPO|nr:hypothetical protein DPMN_047622 [Dreissena polymorpha]